MIVCLFQMLTFFKHLLISNIYVLYIYCYYLKSLYGVQLQVLTRYLSTDALYLFERNIDDHNTLIKEDAHGK